jgi:hypothetical protein
MIHNSSPLILKVSLPPLIFGKRRPTMSVSHFHNIKASSALAMFSQYNHTFRLLFKRI